MTRTTGLQAAAPRLIAEFFVIVIGVLGALAADQWVQDREDRALKAEYLDRLRADAGYDREEVAFIRAVSRSGLAAIDSLLDPGFTDRASDRYSVAQATTLSCDLQVPPGSADRGRREIGSVEAVGELRLQRERYQGLVAVTEALLAGVEDLQRVLDAAD